LRDAGELLVMDLGEKLFVTCFVGILNAADSSLTYASAGHGPTFFYRNEVGQLRDERATGLPISPLLVEKGEVGQACVVLGHGDFVVLASDGFFEAPNAAGERFGIGRLRAALRDAGHLPASEMIVSVVRQVALFVGDAEQEDDMTMVVVRRTQATAGVPT
jgi:sigma-B regulation protein RsbU (phosphoserine phosphatase)